jgi:asparagine synthase (glutamine-hydrolysing)
MSFGTSLVGPETLAELLEKARATPPGCIVEVGVYRGGSAVELAKAGRALYLYDTFTGIPHRSPYDSHQIGDFAETSVEAVQQLLPHAVVIAGIFPTSAITMPDVAFAHLDCDQYQSVLESARYLAPLMVKGGIMWFDDSPCLAGARRAVEELFGDRVKLSYNQKHYVEF